MGFRLLPLSVTVKGMNDRPVSNNDVEGWLCVLLAVTWCRTVEATSALVLLCSNYLGLVSKCLGSELSWAAV